MKDMIQHCVIRQNCAIQCIWGVVW